jgi:multiple sugar transport system permease protein
MQTAPSQLTSGPGSAPPAKIRGRGPRLISRKISASAAKHIVLIALSAMFGLPLLWMVLTSFKTAAQALALPVVWWHTGSRGCAGPGGTPSSTSC